MVVVQKNPTCLGKGDKAMLVKFNRDPLARINRLFDDVMGTWPTGGMMASPELAGAFRVDISEDEKAMHIEAELPGAKKEDIKLQVEDGILTISAERKQETEEKKKNYHRVERIYGHFSRSFTLGDNVDQEHIDAKYDNGVLHVTLPKTEQPKSTKQISVK